MSEEVFQVARNVFGRYGVFFKMVAEEIGAEKALELHAKAHEMMGVDTANTIRKKMGDRQYDLATLGPLLRLSLIHI